MKKIIILLFLFFSGKHLIAQSYIGYQWDNYAGVHVLTNNPANIVDSRFRTDINLASGSLFLTNDYFDFKINDLFKSDFEFDDSARNPKAENNMLFNIDVLGPSFMFNLNPTNSVALFTRGRAIFHTTGMDGHLLDDLNNDNFGSDYSVRNQNFSVSYHSWYELGASYARVLKNTGTHFFKGGISVKYLLGFYNAYVKAENYSLDFNDTGNPLTSVYTSTGTIYAGNVNNLEDIDDPSKIMGSGLGADIGFTYEFRPNYQSYAYKDKEGNIQYKKDKNKYLFRIGLSVTDIGSIRYKDVERKVYDANTTYTEAESNNPDFEPYATLSTNLSTKAILPTALRTNIDWNFSNNLYLNMNTDLSLVNKKKENASYIANNVLITPRYETKWFSAYLPVSYMKYSGFNAGLGLRLGPVFVGSGSIISGLISETKSVDIHFGFKIPVYQGKLKDKDFDGVNDKNDECPDIAGPVENKGCPWKDSDQDGILDKDDRCPDVFGEKENGGCPWGDKDKDTVLDNVDKCPEEYGAVENQGCPWGDQDGDGITDNIDACPDEFGEKDNKGCPWGDRDEDGVKDNIDQCPDVKGTVENNGCPEVEENVIKELNAYAKTILFETGKASFQQETLPVLNSIVAILKEYPSAKFSIEGHTDSDGDSIKNQLLSEQRAKAVKDYLTENGIETGRLISKGFGESKPISTNKTKEGKLLNRRVEIILIK